MDGTNIAEARDEIETAIIMALHMDKARVAARDKLGKSNAAGFSRQTIGMEVFCPKDAAFPKAAYTFDARSSDRIYAGDMSGTVVDPIAAIGHRLETMMLCDDGVLKWSCIKPMPRPKGLTAMTNQPHQWFAYHFRTFTQRGGQDYVKRPMAITQSGEVCRIKPLGNWKGFNPQSDQEEMEQQLALTLSIFEDAHRAGSFLASVEEHVRLMFPIGADAYRAFLIMRDGYKATPTGRKNPILHWCAEHLRTRGDKVSVVEEHLRGADVFIVGPMRLSISASDGYGSFLGATPPAEDTP